MLRDHDVVVVKQLEVESDSSSKFRLRSFPNSFVTTCNTNHNISVAFTQNVQTCDTPQPIEWTDR